MLIYIYTHVIRMKKRGLGIEKKKKGGNDAIIQ